MAQFSGGIPISRHLAPKYSKLVNLNSIKNATVFRVTTGDNDYIKIEIRVVYEQHKNAIVKRHKTKYWLSCSSLRSVPGVYVIKNIETGRMYIGSSNNVKERAITHFRDLLHGCHPNYLLQTDFTRLGPNYFEVKLIAETITLPNISMAESNEISRLLNNGFDLYNMTVDGQGTANRIHDDSFVPQSVSDRSSWQNDGDYYDDDAYMEQNCPFCDSRILKDDRICSVCGVAFPEGLRVASQYIVGGNMMYIFEESDEDNEDEDYYEDNYQGEEKE